MFDAMLLIVMGIVTWCVASDGAHSAAITAVVTVLSGLVAMNLFEPLAGLLQGIVGYAYATHVDVVALVGLFIGAVFALRAVFEKVSPVYVETDGLAYEIGRWGFGLLTGYVTMAFLLTSLHTAPLPREFMGFQAERANLFETLAPDRQWLGFTQWVSEKSFVNGSMPRVFDAPHKDFIDDPNNATRNMYWPSFPIRYAHRREQFAGGGLATGPTAPTQQAAPVRRNNGGGSGAAGF